MRAKTDVIYILTKDVDPKMANIINSNIFGEILQTTKARQSIVLSNYHYYHATTNNNSTRWTCITKSGSKKCCASVTTLLNDGVHGEVFKVNGSTGDINEDRILNGHLNNHGPNIDNDIKEMLLERHLLKLSIAKSDLPIAQQFQRAQSEYLIKSGGDMEKVAKNFPQLETIRSALYKEKRKKFPKNPKSMDNIIIEERWANTEHGNPFLVTNTNNCIIFASDQCLKLLAKSRYWQADDVILMT